MTSIDKNRRLELLADKSFNSSANRAEAIKKCEHREVIEKALATFSTNDTSAEWFKFFHKIPGDLISKVIDKLLEVGLSSFTVSFPIFAVLANDNISDFEFARLEKIIVEQKAEKMFVYAFQLINNISDSSCARVAKLIQKHQNSVDQFLELDFELVENYRILVQAILQLSYSDTSELLFSGLEFLYENFNRFVAKETFAKKYFYYVLVLHIFLKYNEKYFIDNINTTDYFENGYFR